MTCTVSGFSELDLVDFFFLSLGSASAGMPCVYAECLATWLRETGELLRPLLADEMVLSFA
jgi:hypothetical protein